MIFKDYSQNLLLYQIEWCIFAIMFTFWSGSDLTSKNKIQTITVCHSLLHQDLTKLKHWILRDVLTLAVPDGASAETAVRCALWDSMSSHRPGINKNYFRASKLFIDCMTLENWIQYLWHFNPVDSKSFCLSTISKLRLLELQALSD